MQASPNRHHPLGTHPRNLRLRTVVLLVVLVPTIGMVTMSAVLVGDAFVDRDTAQQVEGRGATLASLAEARVALVSEGIATGFLVFAAGIDLDEEELREITGVDHRSEMHASRTAVDSSPSLRSLPEVSDLRLNEARAAVDGNTASSSEILAIYDELTAAVDGAWDDEFARLRDDLRSGNVTGSLSDRGTALRATFVAQQWGTSRMLRGIEMIQTGTPATSIEIQVIEAGTRYRAAAADMEEYLGPSANEAWDGYRNDPAVQRLDTLFQLNEERLVAGTFSPSPDGYQELLADAAVWLVGLGDLVQAAAEDLLREGAQQERDATSSLQTRIVVAIALTILSILGAAMLTRSVTRPVHRLEDAASQIRAGRFNLEPIDSSGPRELADTATAFNEMTTTLASVETYATTLADEPEDPMLDDPIPGRTGQALQVALNRLRSSIRQAEERRQELEVVATHDALTGLLNRSATLLMIERDLAAAERSDGAVMALFIDLDEFKPINDRFGHAIGDEALRLVGDALRESTRQADVAARIGGDEFLVAGSVTDPGEGERLAERIRDAIGSIRLDSPDGPIGLHCSIGMALSRPGDSVDRLVQRADAAMYDAKKQQGFDHIAWAGTDRAEPSSP